MFSGFVDQSSSTFSTKTVNDVERRWTNTLAVLVFFIFGTRRSASLFSGFIHLSSSTSSTGTLNNIEGRSADTFTALIHFVYATRRSAFLLDLVI